MQLQPFFRSILEQDTSEIVICNLEHEILYMNPAACRHYEGFGGAALVGKNLMACHNSRSAGMIRNVLSWFAKSEENNQVHTFFSEKENKDIYMVALRDPQGTLIGYYEKHEYRTRDMTGLYQMP